METTSKAVLDEQWVMNALLVAKRSVNMHDIISHGTSEGHDVASALGRLYACGKIIWSGDFIDLIAR